MRGEAPAGFPSRSVRARYGSTPKPAGAEIKVSLRAACRSRVALSRDRATKFGRAWEGRSFVDTSESVLMSRTQKSSPPMLIYFRSVFDEHPGCVEIMVVLHPSWVFKLRPRLAFTKPDTRAGRKPPIYLYALLRRAQLGPMTAAPAKGRDPGLRGRVAVVGCSTKPRSSSKATFYPLCFTCKSAQKESRRADLRTADLISYYE